MPGITEYVLTGGPCDGKTGRLSPQDETLRQIECGGAIYREPNPAKIDSGHLVFRFAGKAPTGTPAAPDAHALHGWHDLSRSLHKRMPATLRAAEKNRQAALRTLNHARKVRL